MRRRTFVDSSHLDESGPGRDHTVSLIPAPYIASPPYVCAERIHQWPVDETGHYLVWKVVVNTSMTQDPGLVRVYIDGSACKVDQDDRHLVAYRRPHAPYLRERPTSPFIKRASSGGAVRA